MHHEHPHNHLHDHDHEHQPAASPDYSRQIALREVGTDGQARLRGASVLVVGAGGLGVPVLQYLAGAGVGRLGIVDADRLEPSNLHRQTWYALADCGREKSALAAERVRALNPEVRVEPHALRFDAGNADRLATGYDLILDCSDNFTTKFLLNDLALRTRKPVLFASVYQYEGQLQVVRGDDATACLRCVWPEATRDGLVGNCAEAGVLGPVPGVFGSLQALEALKLLLGLPGLEPGRNADLRPREPQHAAPARETGAGLRGASARRPDRWPPPRPWASKCSSFRSPSTRRRIHVRGRTRCARARRRPAAVAGAATCPCPDYSSTRPTLDSGGRYLLICATGKRSAAAADLLRSQGFLECRSLARRHQGIESFRLKRAALPAIVACLLAMPAAGAPRGTPQPPTIRCSISRANCRRTAQARPARGVPARPNLRQAEHALAQAHVPADAECAAASARRASPTLHSDLAARTHEPTVTLQARRGLSQRAGMPAARR